MPLVGTAFDYLFRFEVQRRNPAAKSEDWIAGRAVKLLQPPLLGDAITIRKWFGVEDLEATADKAAQVLNQARSSHRKFLVTKSPSEEEVATLAMHALRLAKLDVIFRAGIVDPALESTDPLDVRDLVGLWNAIRFEGPMSVCLSHDVWLNPTFGQFSIGIQGADADLIASHLLIDIKTSINPDFRQHAAQLMGYAMLADAYRSSGAADFPTLESVGIYFARQGALVSLPLNAARDNPDFTGAFEALMEYCQNQPLTRPDLVEVWTRRNPKGEGRGTSAKRRKQ